VSIAANPKAAVFAVSFLPQLLSCHGALLPTVLVLIGLGCEFAPKVTTR
jgi:threonine/homoserine/homoserine lactone efflux protein